jgi:hypothetical protein
VVVVASVCLVELAERMRADAPSIADKTPDTAPDIAPDTAPDIEPAPERTPPRPVSVRKRDTASAIARVRARHPDMSAADIAQRVGVTDRTVRRHLNTLTAETA